MRQHLAAQSKKAGQVSEVRPSFRLQNNRKTEGTVEMTEGKTPHSIEITLGRTKGFILGSGATARARNIQTVRDLLNSGHSEEDVTGYLENWFRSATICDYIRVAKNSHSITPHELTDTENSSARAVNEINERRRKKQKGERENASMP